MSDSPYVHLNPSTLLGPVPAALISCAEKDHPENRNLLTVAWTGTVNSEPPMLSISVRKSRYSHDLIRDAGEFVVNLTDESMCRAVDYCGVPRRQGRGQSRRLGPCLYARGGARHRSGRPRRRGQPRMPGKTDPGLGSHDLFLAEIVSVMVRPDLMDEKGALHLERARLIGYNHGLYHRLGEVIGFFGWSVAGEEPLRRRMDALSPASGYQLKSARFLAQDAARRDPARRHRYRRNHGKRTRHGVSL